MYQDLDDPAIGLQETFTALLLFGDEPDAVHDEAGAGQSGDQGHDEERKPPVDAAAPGGDLFIGIVCDERLLVQEETIEHYREIVLIQLSN